LGLVSLELCGLIFWIFEHTIIWISGGLWLDLKLWNFDSSILCLVIIIDQAAELIDPLLLRLHNSLLAHGGRWDASLHGVFLNIISVEAWFPLGGSNRLHMALALLGVYLAGEDHGPLLLDQHVLHVLLRHRGWVRALIDELVSAVQGVLGQDLRRGHIRSDRFSINFTIFSNVMLLLILIWNLSFNRFLLNFLSVFFHFLELTVATYIVFVNNLGALLVLTLLIS
jgi:hypothetical protein